MGTLTNSPTGKNLRTELMGFPGAAVVKTLPFHCRGGELDPWLGK